MYAMQKKMYIMHKIERDSPYKRQSRYHVVAVSLP